MIAYRKAVKSDIPSILDLSKFIWEGTDYIPYVVERWISSSNPFIVAVDDEKYMVVGFEHATIYGNSMLIEGLRVHPEYRSNGIASSLLDIIIKKSTDYNIKKIYYLTWFENSISIGMGVKRGFSIKNKFFYKIRSKFILIILKW